MRKTHTKQNITDIESQIFGVSPSSHVHSLVFSRVETPKSYLDPFHDVTERIIIQFSKPAIILHVSRNFESGFPNPKLISFGQVLTAEGVQKFNQSVGDCIKLQRTHPEPLAMRHFGGHNPESGKLSLVRVVVGSSRYWRVECSWPFMGTMHGIDVLKKNNNFIKLRCFFRCPFHLTNDSSSFPSTSTCICMEFMFKGETWESKNLKRHTSCDLIKSYVFSLPNPETTGTPFVNKSLHQYTAALISVDFNGHMFFFRSRYLTPRLILDVPFTKNRRCFHPQAVSFFRKERRLRIHTHI